MANVDGQIACSAFSNFLINREEFINEQALVDIVPQITWVGDVEEGNWNSFSGTTRYTDRFHYTAPDVAQPWEPLSGADCQDNPCDPVRHEIGYGMSRTSTSLERIGYKTDLLCLDALMTMSRATTLANEFPKLLTSATVEVISNYRRIKTMLLAGTKVLANATMGPATFSFNSDFTILTTNGEPTSILLPAMLQRLWGPLIHNGAAGRNGWNSDPAMLKLITDYDTLYGFSKGSGNWAGYVDNWRFTEFDAANAMFTKYGLQGQVGNYMAKVDPTPLRFNKNGAATSWKRVFPRKTESADKGIKSSYDAAFDNAEAQISIVKHRMAWKHLTLQQSALPGISLQTRALSGQWRWANRDLGADKCGKPIDNSDGTKGRWQNDFIYAAEPQHVEWDVAIFHLRQKPQYTIVARSEGAPAAYTASTGSSNTKCATVFTFQAVLGAGDDYTIAQNSIVIDGVNLTHTAFTNVATLTALATAMNDLAATLAYGTWSVSATNPTVLVLTNSGTPIETIEIPFT